MQVCVLGGLAIRDGGREIGPGGPVQRRILARLAMHAGTPVETADLEAAAWADEPPAAARHVLATNVFRLRRLGLAIRTSGDTYTLDTPTDASDAERLAADARRALDAGDAARASDLFAAVTALRRGRPFVDLEDLPAGRVAAAAVDELFDDAEERLLELALGGGRSAERIGEARRLVAAQPYRERRWELLMLALYRAGRQADALDAYAECRRLLRDELGLDPGSGLRRMQQAVLAQDPALDGAPPVGVPGADGRAADDGRAQAPAEGSSNAVLVAGRERVPGTSTRLVGRVDELQDLAEVWSRARLACLVGPPGAGKTRLAIEASRSTEPPVWFVSLEQVDEAQSIASAILDVVAPASRAVDPADGVTAALAGARGLLVLDGCEGRLTEVKGQVERLMAACPDVRVLVTSRERLGILDEALLPVGPLAAADALALLTDRARLLDPRFRLDGPQRVAANRLCDTVDRLPLGIELVARHLQLHPVDEVVDLVEADLGRWAGGPARGRAGLWAALDASVGRLGSAERRALLALAVGAADSDLELIGDVSGAGEPEDELFDTVARLVDASLVQVRSADGMTRYELLRTVAVHALARSDPADADAARGRYVQAVLDRCRLLAGQLDSTDRSATLRRLDREMPHVRAVLGGLLARPAAGSDLVAALDVVVRLTDHWVGRHPAEGLDWLRRILDAADALPSSQRMVGPALRARALLSRSHLAYWVTDFPLAATAAEEAQGLFAALGDALGEGRALRRRGAIAAATDDMGAARGFLEESLARFEAAGDRAEIGTTLLHLGSLLADEGLVDAALRLLERGLDIAIERGDPLFHGHVLAALNLARWKGGELETAMDAGNEALLIFRELGHRPTEGSVAYRLAAIARALGRPGAARRYAQLAVDAGGAASTRTTIAQGRLNLARLDLDAGDADAAAAHLLLCLELIRPAADRWVLVEVVEVAARLLAATGTADAAAAARALLAAAERLRVEIAQPVAPTERADLEWTRERCGPPAGPAGEVDGAVPDLTEPEALHGFARRSIRDRQSVVRRSVAGRDPGAAVDRPAGPGRS